MANQLISWGDMKRRMRATLWPYPGEPRNLRIPHDNYFIDAANDLQKWIKCLQVDNISIFPACSLYFDCGKSLAPAPVGVHQLVYTIANDEWCFPAGTMVLTDIGQKPIERIMVGDRVLTRNGFKSVNWSGMTSRSARLMEVRLANGTSFMATPAHRVWTNEVGWLRVDALEGYHTLLGCESNLLFSKAKNTVGIQSPRTRHTGDISVPNSNLCTERFGSRFMGQFRQGMTSITRMKTRAITQLVTSFAYHLKNIATSISMLMPQRLAFARSAERSLLPPLPIRLRDAVLELAGRHHGDVAGRMTRSSLVDFAGANFDETNIASRNSVQMRVLSVVEVPSEPVYDLTVDTEHEFYANGVLVHNCDKVYYDSASLDDVIAWARNRLEWLAPDGAGLPAIQQGIRYSSKATDSPCGRARSGIYCIHNQRLYVTPWLQSNESLIVEWDGIKKVWGDTDLLDTEIWDADVEKAIREYVRWQDQDKHGCPTPQELQQLERHYRDAAADCNWECENRTQQRPRRFGMQALRAPISAEVIDDAVPDAVEDVPMVFAIIGDFGVAGSAAALAVANMVKGWNPEFILALGDNSYTNNTDLTSYDADIGPFYHEFLFPYIGEYGEVATQQKMFAIIGNHDRDPNGKAQNFAAYFNVLGKPYYDFIKGPCHFLALDGGYNSSNINVNPDGVTYDSVMGQWVEAKLASSQSVWKLGLVHQPPYSSTVGAGGNPAIIGDGTLSYGAFRYPWKPWGADLVLSGHAHNYEHAVVDDFPYIVNGAGGNSLANFVGSPPAYSQFRYNTLNGAQKVTATRSKLILEFFSQAGTLIHTVTLEK